MGSRAELLLSCLKAIMHHVVASVSIVLGWCWDADAQTENEGIELGGLSNMGCMASWKRMLQQEFHCTGCTDKTVTLE
jgi:hypothetical protein